MSEITLEWSENGQPRRQTFSTNQSTKQLGVFRIGRDPARCDLVIHERSVSALHVEIFIDPTQNKAGIRNLRTTNPPLVDGQQLHRGETFIRQGSRIHLGRVELWVSHLHTAAPPPQAEVPSSYGLKCPNPACGKVSDYSHEILQQGCPWCGFSLAAANSVVVLPPNS